jgi:hypothetical protein
MANRVIKIKEEDVVRDQASILMPGLNRPSSLAFVPGKEIDIEFDDEDPISLREVVSFQDSVSRFLSGSKVGSMLTKRNWMGMQDKSQTFGDLTKKEATALINNIGVGAFKVTRFSPGLLGTIDQAIKDGKQIVSSGGSCEVTSADNHDWRKRNLSQEDFRERMKLLPSLMQIYDASLPIKSAQTYINIIEDSLFAEFGAEFSAPSLSKEKLLELFYREGEIHSQKFQKLINEFSHQTKVESAFFSRLPIREYNERFWQMTKANLFAKQAGIRSPHAISRSQVMYSFSGHWVEMLQDCGLIEKECCYLVVEPFHHFTETHNKSQFGTPGTPVYRLNSATSDFYQCNPYGVPGSENESVAGAIGFLPVLAVDGQLGHSTITLDKSIHEKNYDVELEKRRQIMESERVVNMWDDLILADGINHLFFKRKARKAVIKLIDLSWHILEESKKQEKKKGKKNEQKLLRKAMRKDKEFLRISQEAHEVLYDEMETLVLEMVCE